MNNPRILLFAYSEVGATCLEKLIALGRNIVGVFTHEDDPDENIWFRSVAEIARANAVPVFTPRKIDTEWIDKIRQLDPELIFSFYYRRLIPNEILALPRLGAWNLHGSLLPKYRGRAPVNWAVIMGEMRTGVTLHAMTDTPDTGGIAAQEAFDIAPEHTAHDVFLNVAHVGAEMLARILPALESGRIVLREQDESQATTFGKRTPADGRIDWNRDATEIHNLVRGVTHPFPGAFCELEGKKAFVWRTAVRPLPADTYAPGQIVSRDPIVVACARDALELLEVSFEE